MQIRVVKEGDGKMSLLVVFQGTPPLPAVAVRHLEPSEVAGRTDTVLEDFKRKRMLSTGELLF